MAVTSEFAEAVESKRILRVRIMLKDLLLIDPTAAQFEEAEAYASSALDGLYDGHNGEALNYNEAEWNEDYLNEQMVNVVDNFSKERIDLLKRMARRIYSEKAEKIGAEQVSENAQEKRAVRQKYVGVCVTAAGAALTVAGICASQPVLAVVGAVAAVGGVVLIATDKE